MHREESLGHGQTQLQGLLEALLGWFATLILNTLKERKDILLKDMYKF